MRAARVDHLGHRPDIRLHGVVIAGAERADVDHHVDLLRAVAQGGLGFGDLGLGAGRAERKAPTADLHRRAGQFGAHNGTQYGLTQTLAKPYCRASRQTLTDVARVASGFRMVWSMREAMLSGRPVRANVLGDLGCKLLDFHEVPTVFGDTNCRSRGKV